MASTASALIDTLANKQHWTAESSSRHRAISRRANAAQTVPAAGQDGAVADCLAGHTKNTLVSLQVPYQGTRSSLGAVPTPLPRCPRAATAMRTRAVVSSPPEPRAPSKHSSAPATHCSQQCTAASDEWARGAAPLAHCDSPAGGCDTGQAFLDVAHSMPVRSPRRISQHVE
jgi:hypothetical protein